MTQEFLLTEADIRGRSSAASFRRGQEYYSGGAIRRRIRHEARWEAEVEGRQRYGVTVWSGVEGQVEARCSCPYAYGGDCKHIVATLLALLQEPDSFQPPVDLKAILKGRRKTELVELLLDIFTIYPNLVDDLAVVEGGVEPTKLVEKAAQLFDDLAPWGHLSEAEVETHMRLVARQADKLAQQGQVVLARQVYYELVLGCVNLSRSYGSADYFSGSVPYEFAVSYNDLAVDQVPAHGPQIKAEVEELYRDVFDPDMLGLNEALSDIWCELIDHGFVEGQVFGD